MIIVIDSELGNLTVIERIIVHCMLAHRDNTQDLISDHQREYRSSYISSPSRFTGSTRHGRTHIGINGTGGKGKSVCAPLTTISL